MKYMSSSPLNPLKGRFTLKPLSINLVKIATLRGLGVRNTTINDFT
jgi:hypothetical protein